MPARKTIQNIKVQIIRKFEGLDFNTAKMKRLVKAVCDRFKVSRASIGILIVDDADIVQLNKRFLNRKHATDCISFDLSDEKSESKVFDMIVNGQRAIREANRRGHSSDGELALYITHGLLHNLGFDDLATAKAKKMHAAEDEILEQQGFGMIYGSGREIGNSKGF